MNPSYHDGLQFAAVLISYATLQTYATNQMLMLKYAEH